MKKAESGWERGQHLCSCIPVITQPGSVTHHSPAYTELTGSEEVEDATINGAKIMALIGVEILETPSMLDEIKAARRICG